MSELLKIVLTGIIGMLSGVFVFVTGQIFIKFFIEPIHEQRRLIGEIADSLVVYAELYRYPGTMARDERDKAATKLRQQAGQLMAKSHVVLWYGLWQALKFIPSRTSVIEAHQHLIVLSNSIHLESEDTGMKQELARENSDRRKRIEELLGIKTEIESTAIKTGG